MSRLRPMMPADAQAAMQAAGEAVQRCVPGLSELDAYRVASVAVLRYEATVLERRQSPLAVRARALSRVVELRPGQ